MERRTGKARIAVFGVGHSMYWEQFPGLLDKLMEYHKSFCALLEGEGLEILDFGMVDSSEKSFLTADRIVESHADILFCNMLTYATSSVFAPILRACPCPVILAALQPLSGMDYKTANTRMQLENDNICSVPEFTGVAIRFGKPVADVVLGQLENDPEAQERLRSWCRVGKVLNGLKAARFALMGHVLESMYDMHADPTAVASAFGVHVPLLEMDDLLAVRSEVTEAETSEMEKKILLSFDTPDPKSDPLTEKLTRGDLHAAAVSACSLERFVEKYHLTGLAYYYNGLEGGENRDLIGSLVVGNSLLIADGVPMCGEFDVKTCLAMFIMDRLGMGGSFAEFHPFDFREGFIFIGHDGPHHIGIADGKPVIRSLKAYHGKPGHGASVEFKLKTGPITMLCITQSADGRFKFLVAEGESLPGAIPPTGNTNTRAVFKPDTKEFIRRWVLAGPTHHYALGTGHRAEEIERVALSLGIPCQIVR